MIIKAEKFDRRFKIPLFLTCTLGTLLIGMLSGLLSGSSNGYDGVVMPPLAPPSIVFPIVWTILYLMIGLSLYFIITARVTTTDQITAKKTSVWLWGAQIVFNVCWSFAFFAFKIYMFSFVWLCILLAMVVLLIINCFQFCKTAGYLNIPYAVWLAFAAYLNLYIALFN